MSPEDVLATHQPLPHILFDLGMTLLLFALSRIHCPLALPLPPLLGLQAH